MACACKKNLTPQLTAVAHLGPQYDFSSTTVPLLTCRNCALKHIALATYLYNVLPLLNRLIAIGLLVCASYHYNNHAEMSSKCISAAKSILNGQLVDMQQLMTDAMAVTTLDKALAKITPPTQYSYEDGMLHLCAAYSLMFTEFTYEELNRGYAIGLLMLAALYIKLKHLEQARKIRECWKLLQLVHSNDSLEYKLTRKRMIDLITQLYLFKDSSDSNLSDSSSES